MGIQIIKQPNGLYAQFSSVVDDFVMYDATPEDILADWIEDAKRNYGEKLDKIIKQLEAGEKPYYQFTMTFDDAIDRIKDVHGAKTAMRRKKEILSNNQQRQVWQNS